MRARARLVTPGQTGTNPSGVETPIVDGAVFLDASAAIRSTCELVSLRPWPASSDDPAAPYGQELFLERGIEFGNGSTEWISLGYFRLEDTEQESAPVGALRLVGSDRMAGIVDGRLMAPRQFAATATRAAVVDELVREVYPDAVIEWDSGELVQLGRQVIAEEDRHAVLLDVVTSAGKVCFFDYRGVLVIRDAPDAGAPVAELNAGEGGVLVTLGRSLSRRGVTNAVVASGEAPDTGPPARGVAVDADPSSPTYFYGPFGPVPEFYSSPLLITDQQAANAARSILSRSLGIPYRVNLSAVPNPALEPLDPVTITYPATLTAAARSELHILSTLTVPLIAAAPLEATTREQTLATIGEL